MTAAKVMKKRGSPAFLQYPNSTHFYFEKKSADEMGDFEQAANPTERKDRFFALQMLILTAVGFLRPYGGKRQSRATNPAERQIRLNGNTD